MSTRPSRLEILEYAKEGLNTLIGTGSGYEYEEVLQEYEEHREWIEAELALAPQPQEVHNHETRTENCEVRDKVGHHGHMARQNDKRVVFKRHRPTPERWLSDRQRHRTRNMASRRERGSRPSLERHNTMTYSSSDFHSDLVSLFDSEGLIPGLNADAEDNASEEADLCMAALTTLKQRCTDLESALRDLVADAISMDRRLLALTKEPFENEKGSVARALKLLT